ncbi:MAG TPA: hypothetical protein VG651_01610 [Stellaceae bacterium]|nr:hypothetical protein [Stellaceae bacterium]
METIAAHAPVRSQLGEWRRFVVTLLLVLSPLLLAGAALELLAWRVGETMSPAATAKWQAEAPDRVWRGGDGHSYVTYKLARIAELKPDIVAIGPSRANAFRGDVFAPYSFFNAGLTTWTIDQDRRFLELMTKDGYAPRVLVFNLDYWMLSPGFDHYWGNRFDEAPAPHVSDLMRVVGQFAQAPVDLLRRLPATDREHGLFALLTDEGFGPDGVLTPKPTTPDPTRLQADLTEAGTPPAVMAEHLSPEQIAKFDRFAALAKAKHVALVGVQLPYYRKILDGLNDPQDGIWREFAGAEWRRHLADAGVLFFDFADMPDYRDKPEYFIDSLDPDARLTGQVMRRVMADPQVEALLPKAGAH